MKEKIKELSQQLKQLAEDKERVENELYGLVAEPIEEAYKANDMKKVLEHINLLPEGSTMRMFSILKYDQFCRANIQSAQEAKNQENN